MINKLEKLILDNLNNIEFIVGIAAAFGISYLIYKDAKNNDKGGYK